MKQARKPLAAVDLPRARRALAKLDRLAQEHPEAFTRSTAEWMAVLREDGNMVAGKIIAFRFQPALVERIDRFAARLGRDTGLKVSRNAAAAKLLSDALDAEEARHKRKR